MKTWTFMIAGIGTVVVSVSTAFGAWLTNSGVGSLVSGGSASAQVPELDGSAAALALGVLALGTAVLLERRRSVSHSA
jgi:hypothetical protein